MKVVHVLVALALTALGCARESRLNVLIVTFDTTRADRLGCYGYGEPSSPVVDGLAAEGTLFENAFTTNPITLPAHTSLMTGTYPLYHGVRDNSTFFVPDDVTTLAEVLQDDGYDTGAVTGAFVLDSQYNLDQGFDEYNDDISAGWSKDELDRRAADAFGFAERKANLVSRAAVEWLRKKRSKPFFLWVHYFDPHQPVNPPEPHHSRFSEPYAGEIAFADEQLGQVLAELKRMGEYDNTLIVFTADHGEGLLDHGEPSHALLIFDSTMHIPLIVRAPGMPANQRIGDLASIVDIAPTVLDLLGLEPLDQAQGFSLAAAVRGEGGTHRANRSIYMESLVSALQCGWGPLRGLRTGTEKLIHGPVVRYFHVDEDRGEVYDRSRSEPEAVERLTAELAGRMRQWGRPEARVAASTAPDADAAEKLSSLGYLTGGGADPGQLTDTLGDVEGKEDPYEKRWLFDLMGVATENLRTGFEQQGVEQLEHIVNVDPENPMALTNLGKAYLFANRQPQRAIDMFERTLKVNPLQEEPLYNLSRIRRALGQVDVAKEHAEAILAFSPHSVGGHMELSAAYEMLGEPEKSQEQLRQVLDLDPTSLPALLAMGASLGKQRRFDEAGPYLKQALNLDPTSPQILYNVGVWHHQTGNDKEAIVAFTRALKANPGDAQTAFVLGELFIRTENYAAAREILQRARSFARTTQRIAAIDSLMATIQSD